MAYFLAKTDPETYPIERLAEEKRTVWDGVTNAQAVAVIKTMKPGDVVFVYHSMGQAAVVGLAAVVSEPRPDEKNAKSWVVEMEYRGRVEPPVTLKEIKESGLFGEWALVRQSRLSTMAAVPEFVKWIKKLRPGLGL